MKFKLHRDPNSTSQKVPFPAMQVSGLAEAEELTLFADSGCILLSRNDLTTKEALTVISRLGEVIDALVEQLVDTSHAIMAAVEPVKDPLSEFDESVLGDRKGCGADLYGIRMMLAMEDDEQ